ncbi:MAG: response regulator transcription factor [Fimbriimonadaceae bacterium]|nr:response regulator transcription factor [Chitinophagales bacterium]
MNGTSKPKILYVEDDASLGFVTKDNLQKKGYDITLCTDGLEAIHTLQKNRFDLCILDVMLPKLDGFTVAQKIRDKSEHVPIIFLTAKSLLDDKLNAYKYGADDYIIKPFSMDELIFKIEVFLKRNKVFAQESPDDRNIFTISTFEFDFRELTLKNTHVAFTLTLREAELLRMLCYNMNHVVKRDVILQSVWGEDDYYIGRSLDVFISRLRKYFQSDNKIEIENVRGVGFKFIVK